MVLTDAAGVIQHCAYQVGSAMSSLRQVQQGRVYQLPPRVGGIAPSAEEPLEAWQDNITRAAALSAAAAAQRQGHSSSSAGLQAAAAQRPATLLAGATRAYMGVSPALVEELCCMAGGLAPATDPSSLSPQDWAALHGAWRAWILRLQEGSFAPSTCPARQRFSVLGAYDQQHDAVHAMVDGYYNSLQAGEVYGVLHQRLTTAVKHALKKARGRVVSFEQQLAAAGDAAAVQKQGDIIVANLYRCVCVECVRSVCGVCAGEGGCSSSSRFDTLGVSGVPRSDSGGGCLSTPPNPAESLLPRRSWTQRTGRPGSPSALPWTPPRPRWRWQRLCSSAPASCGELLARCSRCWVPRGRSSSILSRWSWSWRRCRRAAASSSCLR